MADPDALILAAVASDERDTISRLRAAGEQLATMLRATGACARCRGAGEVDYHARGVHTGAVRGPCSLCNGHRYAVGTMAALAGWEEAKGTI